MHRSVFIAWAAGVPLWALVARAQDGDPAKSTAALPAPADGRLSPGASDKPSIGTGAPAPTATGASLPADASSLDRGAAPSSAAPSPELPAITPAPVPSLSTVAARVNAEAPLETGPLPMKGKWSPVFYGFVEFDGIHDSTQRFNDVAGNASIKGSSYAEQHGRTQFGMRNSRFGFKLTAPELDGLRITGILEMDFLGNQPGTPPSTAVSENGYFTSPAFRMRHYAMKIENPYVDVMVGQYWQLFGWQTYFHPASVEIQGLPGQLFGRAPQVRLSHAFKSDALNVEIAVAAARPPQRDSEIPDGQAGIRLLINQWKGLHTMGGAGTASDAAGLGISGVSRRFALPEYTAIPSSRHFANGWGLSIDAMLPIIPGTMERRGNALTLTGSFVTGQGIADLYTGLSNGTTGGWPLPNPTGLATPSYVPDIDSGLVEFDAAGRLHPIQWKSFLGGVQYYLPPSGHLWVAVNYARMQSNNILDFVPEASRAGLYNQADWYDANLFWDATVATRFGVEYAHYRQTYGDNSTRTNDRIQGSGWYLF